MTRCPKMKTAPIWRERVLCYYTLVVGVMQLPFNFSINHDEVDGDE